MNVVTICCMEPSSVFWGTNCRHAAKGVSMIEVLLVVAVMGILAAVALPSFKSTIDSNRRAAYATQLLEDLALARSEAIKRGVRVTVCPSADASSCADSLSWASGWIIFTDGSGPGTRDSATETLIRVHEALPSGWIAVKNGALKYVGFSASGYNADAVGFTLAICPASSACDTMTTTTPQTNLVMSAIGRARIVSLN